MAESRYKIKGIGLPFEPQFSSCSDLKPNFFDWSITEGEVSVHVDRGILLQPELSVNKQKRYGWICESRFIVPDVYSFIIQNHKILFENYYNKIYTCDQELLDLNPNFKFCQTGSNFPWIKKQDWNIYDKSKLCSMFCSPKKMTEGHVYRHSIARLLLDRGYDVFGGAHGTPRTVTDPRNPWNTKLDGLKSYMFNIVIENGIYDSYYTEKLTDCFATGTVPVYMGTKNLPKIFDESGIIRLELGKENEIIDTLTPKLYESMKSSIKNNLDVLNTLTCADDDLFLRIKNDT